MINLKEMRRGPGEPEEPLSELPEEEVKDILTKNIKAAEAITKETSGPLEFWAIKNIRICMIDAAHKLSTVLDQDNKEVGFFEREKLQKVALEVMREHGLEMSLPKPKFTSGGFNSRGVFEYRDGTSRQILIYRNLKTSGLSFVRDHHFHTDTGETISFCWTAEGHKLPFRFRVGKFLERLAPKN